MEHSDISGRKGKTTQFAYSSNSLRREIGSAEVNAIFLSAKVMHFNNKRTCSFGRYLTIRGIAFLPFETDKNKIILFSGGEISNNSDKALEEEELSPT